MSRKVAIWILLGIIVSWFIKWQPLWSIEYVGPVKWNNGEITLSLYYDEDYSDKYWYDYIEGVVDGKYGEKKRLDILSKDRLEFYESHGFFDKMSLIWILEKPVVIFASVNNPNEMFLYKKISGKDEWLECWFIEYDDEDEDE